MVPEVLTFVVDFSDRGQLNYNFKSQTREEKKLLVPPFCRMDVNFVVKYIFSQIKAGVNNE